MHASEAALTRAEELSGERLVAAGTESDQPASRVGSQPCGNAGGEPESGEDADELATLHVATLQEGRRVFKDTTAPDPP